MGDAPAAEMTREMKVLTIARTCHEANRSWCQDHGDTSQSPWFAAEPWQRESAQKGVEFALGGQGPEAQHEAWCADKIADGWTYGTVKDPEAKTHPCLVEYSRLPEMQKAKDALFLSIVQALAPALHLPYTPRFFGAGAAPRMETTETPLQVAPGHNVAIGEDAGHYLAAAHGCIMIGTRAGYDITAGIGLTIIGDDIVSLDPEEAQDTLFIGGKLAIGEMVLGKRCNLKDIIEASLRGLQLGEPEQGRATPWEGTD